MADKRNNTEQIEARLCAYIDGELDAAGRAEIEKYLKNNPQHRRLMKELTEARQMLAALPRASAPPEIAEAIQSQLERSVLLDGMDDGGRDVVLRISRWPQIAAAAAILLLTVGLAAVIYYVIPPLGTQPPLISSVQQDPDHERAIAAAPQPDLEEPVARADAALEDHVTRDEPPQAEAFALAPAEVDVFAPLEAAGGRGEAAAHAAVDRAQQIIEQALFRTARFADRANTLFFVVETDDPVETNYDLAYFFASNRIHWTNEQVEPEPLEPIPNQMPFASRLSHSQFRLQRDAEEQLPAVDQPAPREQAAAQPPERPADPDQAMQWPQILPEEMDNVPAASQERALAVQQEPAILNNAFIARNMTVQQAEELHRKLNQPQARPVVQTPQWQIQPEQAAPQALQKQDLRQQRVWMVGPSEQVQQPMRYARVDTRPVDPEGQSFDNARADAAPLGPGDDIEVVIEDMVGPGIATRQVARIAEDGQITVPLIGPVPVAGRSELEAEQAVQEAMRRHNITQHAPVVLRKVDAEAIEPAGPAFVPQRRQDVDDSNPVAQPPEVQRPIGPEAPRMRGGAPHAEAGQPMTRRERADVSDEPDAAAPESDQPGTAVSPPADEFAGHAEANHVDVYVIVVQNAALEHAPAHEAAQPELPTDADAQQAPPASQPMDE